MAKKKTLYSQKSDGELYHILETIVPQYVRITESEKIAAQILYDYGITFFSTDLNERFKLEYRKLLAVVHMRDLKVPEYFYFACAKAEDIIKRIEENLNREINWLQENSHLLDGYVGGGMWSFEPDWIENYYGADIRSSEVREYYENIIKDVRKMYGLETLSNDCN